MDLVFLTVVVSFVTNTNGQSYSGESTTGHLTQMADPRCRFSLPPWSASPSR